MEVRKENSIIFKVGIKNIFDDTFNDKPYINGTIKVWEEPGELISELNFLLEDLNNLTIEPNNVAWFDVKMEEDSFLMCMLKVFKTEYFLQEVRDFCDGTILKMISGYIVVIQ